MSSPFCMETIPKGKAALVRGLDSRERVLVALAACNSDAKAGRRALYLCKGPIAIPDMERIDERILLGSYDSIEDVPGILRLLEPSFLAINPINPSCGSAIWSGGRLISETLFGISSYVRERGAVAIFFIEEPIAAQFGRTEPRYYGLIKKFCDLEFVFDHQRRMERSRLH
uniref:Uncharacterized protein n=1 Tax=Candidatus Methanomethylicus mesodigestus TaxID=1867258 RepID=A0A7C3N796_9CREN